MVLQMVIQITQSRSVGSCSTCVAMVSTLLLLLAIVVTIDHLTHKPVSIFYDPTHTKKITNTYYFFWHYFFWHFFCFCLSLFATYGRPYRRRNRDPLATFTKKWWNPQNIRLGGIEPPANPWKGFMLPLHQKRIHIYLWGGMWGQVYIQKKIWGSPQISITNSLYIII